MLSCAPLLLGEHMDIDLPSHSDKPKCVSQLLSQYLPGMLLCILLECWARQGKLLKHKRAFQSHTLFVQVDASA